MDLRRVGERRHHRVPTVAALTRARGGAQAAVARGLPRDEARRGELRPVVVCAEPGDATVERHLVHPLPDDVRRMVRAQDHGVRAFALPGHGLRTVQGDVGAGDLDVAVERTQALDGGVDLGGADVLLGVEQLAVEIGQLHDVVVHAVQAADARRGQSRRRRGADAADPQDDDLGRLELGLEPVAGALRAEVDGGEEDLAAAVAVEVPRGQFGRRRRGRVEQPAGAHEVVQDLAELAGVGVRPVRDDGVDDFAPVHRAVEPQAGSHRTPVCSRSSVARP